MEVYLGVSKRNSREAIMEKLQKISNLRSGWIEKKGGQQSTL
jgi:hypothetical protein